MTAVMQDIEDGLRDLETQDADPLKISEDVLPLFVELPQLRLIGEAQARSYEQLASIFEKAAEEGKSISADLRPELVVERRRSIKEAAMERGREIHKEMTERAKMAALTREFFEPRAVRQRAVLADPKRSSELVTCLTGAPSVSLLGYARFAVSVRDVAMATIALESVQARAADVPDDIASQIKVIVGALPLPEAEEGKRLCIDILGSERDAQIAIRSFVTGRADVTGLIARGLRQRND